MAGSFMIAITVLVFSAANSSACIVSSSSSTSRHLHESHHLFYEKSLKDLLVNLEVADEHATTRECTEIVDKVMLDDRAEARADRDIFSFKLAALKHPAIA